MSDLKQKTMIVDLVLKNKQATINNLWEFTHNGESKLVTGAMVQYYAEDEAAALASFKWDEVKIVFLDGVELLQKRKALDYRDLLVKSLADGHKALVYGDAKGDKSYGEVQVNYQSIIDELTSAAEGLKQCILILETLRDKRANIV